MKDKPSSLKVGRRTGVSVLTDKNIRRENDGTDNFNDYWTDSSHSSSSELDNSPSKSFRNDILSFNDSLGESETQGIPVRSFLTRRPSSAYRKSALKSPFATKCDASVNLLNDNVAKNSLRKRRQTFNDRSIQTSLKKKAYSGAAEDSPASVSRWQSPRRRLNLDKTELTKPDLQSLPLERTMVDKSINTIPRNGFQRQNMEQSTGTSTDEEGDECPAELTAVPSQLQIKRQLNFDSPKSVKGISKSLVQEKTMTHKSIGTSPAFVSRKSSSPEASHVPSHITSTSFDRGNSPENVRLKSGKRISASEKSVLEDSGMQFSVEIQNEEGSERLNFKSPKHGKRVSKSNSFVQEKTIFGESMNITPALQSNSFPLQDVNLSNVPSHITGTPSDQEGNRHVEKRLRSGKRISAPKSNALEDSGVQGSVEAQIGESLDFRSPKSQKRVSKSKSFVGDTTITSRSTNGTPASVPLRSSLKQQSASSTNVPSHITGTPLVLEKSRSLTNVKKSLKSGRRISFPRNSAFEDSVMQDSVEMQNEEDVERLDYKTPKFGKGISKSKSYVREKAMLSKSMNLTPASASRKSFHRQNSSLNDVASHITSPDRDKSGSPTNVKQSLKSGKRISLSKSLALEDSIAQGGGEMQNGGGESQQTKDKLGAGKSLSRVLSFVLEKTVLNKSCNTSGVCTVQKNVSLMQNAESREIASPSATSLVAKRGSRSSQDGAENHQEEMVPAASDNISSNDKAVCDNGNVPDTFGEAIQEEATASHSGRPRRNRIPPLAHWRNERRRFCYMPSGNIVDLGVDPGTQEDRVMIERMMKRKKNIPNNTAKPAVIVDKPAVIVDKPAVIVDSGEGEQIEVLLQSRFSSQKWTVPIAQSSGKPAYKVCHSLWSEKVSFGFVEIAAGCKKSEQYSPGSSLHFVVLQGKLVFYIKENSYKLVKNDSISIPLGTPYSIDNNGKTKALLHFCSTTLPLF